MNLKHLKKSVIAIAALMTGVVSIAFANDLDVDAKKCKERVDAVYKNKNGTNTDNELILIATFFRGGYLVYEMIYDQAKSYYSRFYDAKPKFEEAKMFHTVSTSVRGKKITGYTVQMGVGSDEGSVLFTFDADGNILYGKSIDQSPEYKYLCNVYPVNK